MMMEMRPAADSYTYDVGLAGGPEIRAKTSDVLARFGYRVVKDDGSENVYLESQWQSRQPVDDQERASGNEIISRVTMAGAPRDRVDGAMMYHVLLTVENRFVPSRGTKRDARVPASSAAYARSIVKEMSVAFGGTARPVAAEQLPF